MKALLLIAIMPLVLLVLPARAEVVAQRGDWTLVCDNRAECTIIGAPGLGAPSGYPQVEVRIFRRNRPGHPLLLATRLTDLSGSLTMPMLTLEGMSLATGPFEPPLATLRPEFAATQSGEDRYSPEDSPQLVGLLARRGPLVVRSGFGLYAVLPQGDLAALLVRMDRAQPNIGDPPDPTVEDLPSSPPVLYELFPREAVAPPPHAEFDRACGAAPDRQVDGFTLDHSITPSLLVHLACAGRHRFYVWNPQVPGSQPSTLTLRRAHDRRFSANDVVLDADAGVVTVIDHPPGRSDCGAANTWGGGSMAPAWCCCAAR